MPEQGIDMTSPTEAVMWILVDAVGPQVVEFSSPRESSTLEIGEHFVRVIISENYGIDADSVELFWWVTSKGQNDAIISGFYTINIGRKRDYRLASIVHRYD